MDRTASSPAKLLAVGAALLTAAWSGFVVAKYAAPGHALLSALLVALALGAIAAVAFGRASFVFLAGFGILAVAIAAGYYLGVVIVPAAALCWASGMLAAYAVPTVGAPLAMNRLLGWGLFAAMAAYAAFFTHLMQAPQAPHDQRSTTRSLTR